MLPLNRQQPAKMDRCFQFVLFAAFVASIYSYKIDRERSLGNSNIPPVFHDPNFYYRYNFTEYPAEFIKKLIAELTPKELEMLKINRTDVEHRDGDLGSNYCNKYIYNFYPTLLPAADKNRTWYIVINTPPIVQKYEMQVCNFTNGHQCYKNATRFIQGSYKGCCSPKEIKEEMVVLSVPYNDEMKRNVKKDKPTLVKKLMYFKKECTCKTMEQHNKYDRKCPKS